MRLRLLKLACLVLVLALAGGLIVFNFADDDLQSAFIQTSSVTPAKGIDAGAQASASPPGAEASAQPASDVQRQSGSGQGAALAPITPSANEISQSASGAAAVTPVPAPPTSALTDTAGTATPAPAAETTQAAAPPAPATTEPMAATVATAAAPPPGAAPAQAVAAPPAAATAAPAPMPAADASSAAPTAEPAEKAASTTASTAPPAADSPPGKIASTSSSESSYAAVVWPEDQPSQAGGSDAAAAPKPQAETSAAAAVPPVTRHRAAKPRSPASAAPVQAAERPATTGDPSDIARAAPSATPTPTPEPSPPLHKLVAQVAPPHASAQTPLVPSPAATPPSRDSDFAAHVAVGPQMLIEFPSLQSNASGSLAGSGSVTNSSARVIPGIIGSWTSAPLADLPLKPSFGGSLFIGAPASGDSVASATTSGGYTLKLGQTNDWPVIMPRFFMGLPVADGTRASFGTGIWVNNVKETATLANSSGSQSDERAGVMMRPFLSAAIEQHAPLFGFLPSESQRLKVSGGYIFGDSAFSASFCAAGQTCIRTEDQGSWFLGLSFQMGFPAAGAPAP